MCAVPVALDHIIKLATADILKFCLQGVLSPHATLHAHGRLRQLQLQGVAAREVLLLPVWRLSQKAFQSWLLLASVRCPTVNRVRTSLQLTLHAGSAGD
mmetsp:Transcript_7778/g.23021  ORF Transcript_7778/g.23021 Transcript_7778/m.23021 type:complete len:99 (-) Transcript_7778:679-975(-)